jgi:hypothetical protein
VIHGATTRDVSAELAPATHKQVRTIQPSLHGKNLQLKTFCLNAEGNVLACCSSSSSTGMIQIYSPKGELLKTIPLDFVATAIDLTFTASRPVRSRHRGCDRLR